MWAYFWDAYYKWPFQKLTNRNWPPIIKWGHLEHLEPLAHPSAGFNAPSEPRFLVQKQWVWKKVHCVFSENKKSKQKNVWITKSWLIFVYI